MPWGSGSWGASPWGDGDNPVFGLGDSKLTGMDVVAVDTLLLNWDRDMKRDANLLDITNYTITADAAGDPVTLIEMRAGSTGISDALLLIVTAPTVGEQYTVTVDATSAIRSAADEQIDVAFNNVKFIGRRTKVDDTMNSMPQIYDNRPAAIFRNILNAIGREDDIIGGERDDRF